MRCSNKYMVNICDQETWPGKMFDTKEEAIHEANKALINHNDGSDIFGCELGEIEGIYDFNPYEVETYSVGITRVPEVPEDLGRKLFDWLDNCFWDEFSYAYGEPISDRIFSEDEKDGVDLVIYDAISIIVNQSERNAYIVEEIEKIPNPLKQEEEIQMDKLISDVEEWSNQRGLNESDYKAQFLKVIEEVGELAQGMAKNKPEVIVDSFGDVFVTLVILNQQLRYHGVIDHDLAECLNFAYQEIKDRKGEMINGTFVKEEDLS
ncbi:MazG-like family protein [Aerococcus sp. HMSC062A02]|uniref:MazG-like family protein n=1 Tax=Aerococcus sp. HMSC062A02 TaxID=1715105 RepID=UPI00352E5FEC